MPGENCGPVLVQGRPDQRIANELANDKMASYSLIRLGFVDRGIKLPPLDNPPKICYTIALVTLGKLL
jgi:hypothetical protein